MKRYIVKLSEEEKKDLHALTHKGACGVRKLRRAQMLLLANEGLTDEEIARALDGSVSTVEQEKLFTGAPSLFLARRPYY